MAMIVISGIARAVSTSEYSLPASGRLSSYEPVLLRWMTAMAIPLQAGLIPLARCYELFYRISFFVLISCMVRRCVVNARPNTLAGGECNGDSMAGVDGTPSPLVSIAL
ncbi:hypothetical protein BDZ94DRAFT_1253048 [Collybia nuda]|uniref:Uncharacterized protein n=1 Tax=Collybia nuda TaxID=64659 RepID=A0A9P5YBP4_9AGAR|nr:hypothetical protein BDZ94DRAFT_1253048 [Collybia nuda]